MDEKEFNTALDARFLGFVLKSLESLDKRLLGQVNQRQQQQQINKSIVL